MNEIEEKLVKALQAIPTQFPDKVVGNWTHAEDAAKLIRDMVRAEIAEAEMEQFCRTKVSPENYARFPEYRGISYQHASMAAQGIINGMGWYKGFERLQVLHAIMGREAEKYLGAA